MTVGGVGLVELPLDDLRGHVALVTQEHHVFVGTLRENLALAARRAPPTTTLRAALRRGRRPRVGRARCPTGLDTVVGSGGRALTAAQAQQVALARLVLADPHTLVLDEATSLIDPRAARHLERSLAAVLDGPHRDRDRAPAASPRTTPTGSRWSRTAGSPSSARTTSWSPPAAPTPRSGTPGTASADLSLARRAQAPTRRLFTRTSADPSLLHRLAVVTAALSL